MDKYELLKQFELNPKFNNTEVHFFTGDIFEGGAFHNEKLYYALFKDIPNQCFVYKIQNFKVIEMLKTELASLILRNISYHSYKLKSNKIQNEYMTLVLRNQILVHIGLYERVEIYFQPTELNLAKAIAALVRNKAKLKKHSKRIHFVVPNDKPDNPFALTEVKNRNPRLNLMSNYNYSLFRVHQTILSKFNSPNSDGLVLLHGLPGTGKSTYIRYLIEKVKKKVIFLPISIAARLDSPQVLPLLLENPNSILVIEDAEELLVSRDAGAGSNIAALLNLTDGVLGKSLNIQVLCTFNTSVSNLDKALLRKGRLIAIYHFDALSVEKANALLLKLGVSDFVTDKPMTLADIYNLNLADNKYENKDKKQIGFLRHSA